MKPKLGLNLKFVRWKNVRRFCVMGEVKLNHPFGYTSLGGDEEIPLVNNPINVDKGTLKQFTLRRLCFATRPFSSTKRSDDEHFKTKRYLAAVKIVFIDKRARKA